VGRQYFPDLGAETNVADFSAIVATTETNLLTTAANISLFTPIQTGFSPTGPQVGKILHFVYGGIVTTGASGTLTLTPRYGTTTAGVTLGASGAQTVPVSLTNVPWIIEFWLVCRALSSAASSSTFVGTGYFAMSGTLATAGSGCVIPIGGTTATTCDTTIANGLCMGWTLSVAGSVTPKIAMVRAIN
jgi:hypothetical protein